MLQMFFLQQLLHGSRLLLRVDLAQIYQLPPSSSPGVRGLLLSICYPQKEKSLESGVLHGHVAVWAAVPKRAPLLLEGDEVPYGHHRVFRHIEVEQFHTGEGVESVQLTRRTGEIISHKKAICGEQSQIKLSLKICEQDNDM